jgi:hypothetical protein
MFKALMKTRIDGIETWRKTEVKAYIYLSEKHSR